MVAEALMNELNNCDNINEGWLGNMFKQGAKSAGSAIQQSAKNIGNAVQNGYNRAANAVGDFNQKVNQATADEYNGKADQLSQEIAGLSTKNQELVKQYRSKLLSQVNTKVSAYAKKLKAGVVKMQGKMQGYQQKAAGYQGKVDARNTANSVNNFGMMSEKKLDEIVRGLLEERKK